MSTISPTFIAPIYQSVLSDQITFRDVASKYPEKDSFLQLKVSVIAVIDKDGNQIGDWLDDNCIVQDFNRYHDVYHYAKDQILHYSPTLQSLKGIKTTKRDISCDEASVRMLQNGFKKNYIYDDLYQRAFEMAYDHHKEKPSFDLFEHAMINAHDVFQEMISIKKANPDPIDIFVGHNAQENKIEVQGFEKVKL